MLAIYGKLASCLVLLVQPAQWETASHHLSSQQWWDFLIRSQPDSTKDEAGPLNGKDKTKTRAQLCQRELYDLFMDSIYMTQGSILGPKESVTWCNQTILIASFTDPPVHLVCTILWEIFELGFQHELHALDCAMVPNLWVKAPNACLCLLACMWPGQHREMMWKGSLPQEWGDLLGFMDTV